MKLICEKIVCNICGRQDPNFIILEENSDDSDECKDDYLYDDNNNSSKKLNVANEEICYQVLTSLRHELSALIKTVKKSRAFNTDHKVKKNKDKEKNKNKNDETREHIREFEFKTGYIDFIKQYFNDGIYDLLDMLQFKVYLEFDSNAIETHLSNGVVIYLTNDHKCAMTLPLDMNDMKFVHESFNLADQAIHNCIVNHCIRFVRHYDILEIQQTKIMDAKGIGYKIHYIVAKIKQQFGNIDQDKKIILKLLRNLKVIFLLKLPKLTNIIENNKNKSLQWYKYTSVLKLLLASGYRAKSTVDGNSLSLILQDPLSQRVSQRFRSITRTIEEFISFYARSSDGFDESEVFYKIADKAGTLHGPSQHVCKVWHCCYIFFVLFCFNDWDIVVKKHIILTGF